MARMKAHEEAEKSIRSIIPEGAIDGNPWEEPPTPDMVYDHDINKWVPPSFKDEKKRMLDNEFKRYLKAYSSADNDECASVEAEASELEIPLDAGCKASKSDSATVQREQQCTTVPDTPRKTASVTPKKKAKPRQSAAVSEPPRQESPAEVLPTPAVCQPQDTPKAEESLTPQSDIVEQSKKSRRSAKMDATDFAVLADRFIHPTDIKEKKPLFFPDELRESLRTVAGLIPGGKVSPSHIAILIVEAWFDEHRELINRMLSNKMTSV